jgi:hypothetical protein
VNSDELLRQLDRSAWELDDAAGELGWGILGIDDDRSRCGDIARRYDTLADRVGDEYPSLVGPASRLGELFRELDVALGRLSAKTEELVVCSDRMVAQVREMTTSAS